MLVIVVINQNSSDVSQTFTLHGKTASTVNALDHLRQFNSSPQALVSVSDNTFTYNLPAFQCP